MADTPESPFGPQTLRELGGFELIQKIGAGGMGMVFKARQKSMDRLVALKVLSRRHASDPIFVARFKREAQAVARLMHPNIVSAYLVGEDRGYHFLAMEYVDGESLGRRLKRVGRLPEEEALAITLQIAEALEHAHKNGLVHRDIKPDNVLLNSSGIAKVTDLGLARMISNEDPHLTNAGETVGTPLYMSPEQARGEENLDIRTDIYALGATLFHLVTGQPPFAGTVPAAVLARRLVEDPPDPRTLEPKLSRGAAAVILHMLARDADERHRSPAELIEDLKAVQKGEKLRHARIAPRPLAPSFRRSTAARRAVSGRLARAAARPVRTTPLPRIPSGRHERAAPEQPSRVADPRVEDPSERPAAEKGDETAVQSPVMESPDQEAAPESPSVPNRSRRTGPRRSAIKWPWFLAGAGLVVALAGVKLRGLGPRNEPDNTRKSLQKLRVQNPKPETRNPEPERSEPTPFRLTRDLVLWLKADAGIKKDKSDYLKVWSDQSGQGHDGTATPKGIWRQPKWIHRAVNGRPGIWFDGRDDQVTFERVVQDEFTLFVVFSSRQDLGSTPLGKDKAKPGTAGLVDAGVQDEANDFGLTLNAEGRVLASTGNPDTSIGSVSGLLDGQAHVAVFRRARETGEIGLYVDGGLQASGTGGRQSLEAAPRMVLGSLQTNANYFRGYVAEVLVYAAALTDNDRRHVEQYLRARYLVAPPRSAPAPAEPDRPTEPVVDESDRRWPIRINFQTTGAPVPAGYLVDSGAPFGDRGDGRAYGWKRPNYETRDRDSKRSPDQRYDTLNHLQKHGQNHRWELALPNGNYRVHLVAGDPDWYNGLHKLEVEGVLALEGPNTREKSWLENTVTVTVKDGRLTLQPAEGAKNSKICFIRVAPAGPR